MCPEEPFYGRAIVEYTGQERMLYGDDEKEREHPLMMSDMVSTTPEL